MNGRAHVFICPPLDGPRTGGTLYNAALLRALATRGISVAAQSLDEGRRSVRGGAASRYLVDTLYLEHLPALRRDADSVASAPPGKRASPVLVVHYLPSLVALGRPPRPGELTAHERAALDGADGFLVPSAFMQDVLGGLGVPATRVVVIEPGIELGRVEFTATPRVADTTAALIVANLVPGKGLLPFLTALERVLTAAPVDASSSNTRVDGETPPLCSLSIAGSAELDDAYARRCHALVAGNHRLRSCVRFLGSLSHAAVMECLSASDVLISPSRMEAFGMVLSEARAAGVPILARRGGNTAALVRSDAGGELFDDDDDELARGVVELARNPQERLRRAALAARARLSRTWDDAASQFIERAATWDDAAPEHTACDDSPSFSRS